MQIQCPKCEQWTDSEEGICQLCGATLTDDPDAPPAPQPSNEPYKNNTITKSSISPQSIKVVTIIFSGLILLMFVWGSVVKMAANAPDSSQIASNDKISAPIESPAEQMIRRDKATANSLMVLSNNDAEKLIARNHMYAIPLSRNASHVLFEEHAQALYKIHSQRDNHNEIPSTFDERVLGPKVDKTYYCMTSVPSAMTPNHLEKKSLGSYMLIVRRNEDGEYKAFLRVYLSDRESFGIDYNPAENSKVSIPVLYGIDDMSPKLSNFMMIVRNKGKSKRAEMEINDPELLQALDLGKTKPPNQPLTTIRMVFPTACELCTEYYYLVYREFVLSSNFKLCYNLLVPSEPE
ncbi:MAG: hypothetical protein J6A01_09065 [Proteobacteria bacterium]|nr:hypothetical protein [Pseudomonadota bacterium]